MAKKGGLGRTFENIIDDNDLFEAASGGVERIRLTLIEPKPNQPRQNFDAEALAVLADSIAQNGVLQPILVRPSSQAGFYQIIAGERRWRASKMAGLTDIPAVVIEADELKAAQFALIENIQREDLDAWEEAVAYSRLLGEYELSQEELASRLGKSRSAIANTLRLLDLPEEIVALLRDKQLSAGHCRALLGLKDKSRAMPIAQKAILRNLSVREIEAAVKTANRAYAAEMQAEETEDDGEVHVDYVAELERRATTALGRRLRIQSGKRKKIVTIEYQNDEDLEDILTRICGDGILD
ncbi:MAG: ParB/RepB/Spo0J family partition protein [Clostridia bacterium]|nr:ParB/RepB/Spo0J family partition protein [Clostridia bacterium]